MARIQKKSPKLNLSRYQTLIVDTKDNSEYFRLSEVPDTLTSGKNGFLIEGSTFLKPTTEIKIEVLDVDGNTLFVQPGEGIPEYYEGLSKLISIYVYQDTPIGIGKITILGEAESYIDENGLIKPVPEEWTGIYNVKWEKEIKINKNLLNESKVRFVKRPEVIIEELGESFYSKTISTETQTTGTVKGIAVTPSIGTDLRNYAGGVIYYIKNELVPFEDGAKDISIVGTQIQSASIVEYVNQYTLLVRVPHTSSEYIVGEFSNANYGLNYQYINSIAESSLFGSFARFEINNLATFVGDVERVKLYGKSNAVSADYNLLYDARIDSQNLLETIVSGSIIDRGFFSASYGDIRTWNTYWTTESLAGSGQILLDTNDLYKSVKFRNYKVKSNVGNDIRLERGSEYTLEFYVYYKTPSQEFISNKNDKLKVYATSGLRQGNGLTPNYYFTTSLDTLSGDNKWRTPIKISYNFIPNVTDDWSINFETINEDTVLGDTFWQVGSVKIYGSNELGYSPDEFGFTLPIQRQIEQENFDFRLEYYDLNNNFVPIQNTTSKTFVSGNLTLLGKNLSVDADKLFFTFEENSLALPDPQEISINAYKTRLVGNILITSQAFDSGGVYIPPATFLGTSYPGNIVNRYEDLTLFTGSLKIADFTGSLHGVPPGPGNVIVDKILYTFTEAGSSQPQVRRLSISRVLTNSGTGSVGSAGADAKTVNLTSNIYAIPYGSDGIEIGTNNIFLTASQQNHVGVVYYEFLQDGVTKQNTTSEYYTVLNAEKPNTGSRNSWKVNTREGSNTGTVIAFDTIDLFGLKDGVSGWTVFLTNNTTAFPATADGIVSSVDLASGTTDVVFYRGTSSFTYDQTAPYDINSYRTGSITASANISYSSSIVNNQLRFIPTAINTNGGIDLSGSIIIPLIDNYANVIFPQVYTFTISKQGETGTPGASGSDAIVVSLTSDRYTFNYNGNGFLTPTAQTASLTASAQTGSKSWGADIYYQFQKNGVTKATSTSPYYIITGSESASAGGRDLWKVNLLSGSSQTLVAFDTLDIYGIKDGGDAKTVSLNSPYYVITYNANNSLSSPSSLFKVTASAQNFTAPYFKFTGDIDSPEGTYTLGSSSYEDTASFTPPATYFATPKSIRVGVAESYNPTQEIAYDTITIAAVKPGSDGINGLIGELYYIKPISGTQIRNSQGTLEIQAIYVSGTVSYDLQSGSVVLATGSSAGSVLQTGNGVTAGTNGVAFNAIINSAGISGSRTIILKDTGSNKIYDTITLIDVTDGLGGGSALTQTLIFRRDSGSVVFTPSTGSLTASFFGTNDVEYQERYRVYPYFEAGIDKMYFTIDTDSSFITASVDNGDGVKLGTGFQNRNSTKDLNFIFEFRDPQTNNTSSFVETLYIISDGGDGEDSYTVLLTNESHNLATDNTGVVDYNGSGTSILAFKGATELNGITNGTPVNGQFSASFEVVSGSIDVGTVTSPGNPIVVGNHSNMITTSSLIRFIINLEGSASFTKLQSLAKAIEGDDGYTIFLTNETHAFPADEQGNVSTTSLTAGATEIRFLRGTTQYTYNQTGGTNTYRTGSITASFNITASQTVVTTDGINNVRFTPTSVTGSTQLSGSIIIPVLDNATNASFTKTYTFSISKAGTSGSNALTILINPSNQSVSKSKAGAYQSPVTFSIQVFETGSALRYTGSNNPLQNGYFTVYLPTGGGTLTNATASLSASIAPTLVTTDTGVSSSFAVQYRDSKGNLSAFISQSHYIGVVREGNDGINGASGSDARSVNLTSDRYTFTYDQNGTLSPLTAQTASLTASAQTGSANSPWGANIFYQFVKNGTTKITSNNPYYIITGSEIPTAGGRDFWQVNLLSGSSQTLVAFDNIDVFGLKSGSDAYTVFLTNEAHTFVADDLGNVSTSGLSAGATEIRFFRGTTQYTYNQTGTTGTYRTGSVTASFNITASQTVVNNDVRFTPTNVTGSTGQLSGSILIPVIDNFTGTTFIKTYTFGISKAGVSGSNSLGIILNPNNQVVSKSQAGTYQKPVTFSIQVFETGSPLLYTGSNNTLQNGYFTIFAPSAASFGTLIPATGSLSASIIPASITTDIGGSSSFAVVYRDSKGTLSTHISQSHRVAVVSDGINGSSGSDAFSVNLISNRYTFTYDQNGTLTPLTSQTASLTASAQTGSASKPWGANIFYEWLRNGTTISPANYTSPFWIITSSAGPSPIPSPGAVDVYQVNLRSGSSQALVAFDNIDLFGLRSGSDGYTVFLTNEAHTFPADDQGNVNVSTLSAGATDIRFFRGATQYTYNQTGTIGTYRTGSVTASFNITASQTIINNDVRFTPTNVTGSTGQLSGSIIIPVIDNATNISFTKNYTFSITRAGTSGSNAIDWWMTPSVQTVTASLSLGTYSTASRFNVYVFETGSPMRYTTSDPPTTRGTWTIVMSSIGSNGTNNSLANEISGTITPPLVTAIRPFTSSFQIRYLDSKGNLSNYISQSHIVNVVSLGQTGPGVVFTGPWSSSRTYQYSEGSSNGRRDVVLSGSSTPGVFRYYGTLQQHVAGASNYPTDGASNAFWQYLGEEDYFVAAKIAIFEQSYVQNTLNVGTTNYEAGFSSANITIDGGTQYPYISIGQSPVGYGNPGIWIGNDTGNYRTSFVAQNGPFLRWDGSGLFISGNISASEGRIGGLTISSRSLFLGAGAHENANTPFFVSTSGDFSLADKLVWDNTTLSIAGIVSASAIIGGTGDFVGAISATSGTIGGWNIVNSELISANSSMSLNAATSTISIASGSVTTVVIKSGVASDVGGTVNVTFVDLQNLNTSGSSPSNTITGSYSTPGNIAVSCTGDVINRAITRQEAGTYTISISSAAIANPLLTLKAGFQGRVNINLWLQLSNEATFSNPSTYTLGGISAFQGTILGVDTDYSFGAATTSITHTFTEGTWYMRLKWGTAKTSITYGRFIINPGVSNVGSSTTGGSNPDLTFAKQISFTEISDGAIQVVSQSNRYVKLIRDGTTDRMLEVAGSITATGNITAYYSSDERLKENVFTIKSALDKLDKISGVEFDWSETFINREGGEDGYFVRKHDVGVIAQEIEKVLPEVVAIKDDGYKAVRYEKIVPLLIEAIKELREEIRKLKK